LIIWPWSTFWATFDTAKAKKETDCAVVEIPVKCSLWNVRLATISYGLWPFADCVGCVVSLPKGFLLTSSRNRES